MKCPCCNKDMKKGYVRAIARGGICWVDEKDNLSSPRSNSGFLQLGKATWLLLNMFLRLIVILAN